MWNSRPNGRRGAGWRWTPSVGALGLALVLSVGSGCAQPRAADSRRPSAGAASIPTETTEAATQRALASGDEATWNALTGRLLAEAEDPVARARDLRLAAGQEEELFGRLLDHAAKQGGPAEAVLRESAYAVARFAPPVATEHLLELIAHRECCLQRSHLASALEGLRLARVESGQPQAVSPETRRLLVGLSRHVDLALAGAAVELLPWIVSATR